MAVFLLLETLDCTVALLLVSILNKEITNEKQENVLAEGPGVWILPLQINIREKEMKVQDGILE